jgi:tRNA threonylcarbamoyl adenosine modification protein YjeE
MTESPAEVAPAITTLDELATCAERCVACPELAATRTTVVVGCMPPGAEVLLIGEAPGAQEDVTGVPFVGKSGQLLDKLLAEAGMPRDRVAVANVLKCRPPGNRKPRRDEVENCRPWLERQIELLDPLVICTLGGTAAEWAFGTGVRIAALRGNEHTFHGRPLVATYHPAAAIRFGPNGAPLAALREDLALVARLAAERRRQSEEHAIAADARQMRAIGERLAARLQPGDLVVLTGELGAGKTTLAQGIGAGLGVRGPVTSPTFVIARVHPPLSADRPPLVHVDAYRLGSPEEVDDLDLDALAEASVTVVEWGEGKVENLTDDRLEVRIERASDAAHPAAREARRVTVRGIGARWAGALPPV